jgi:flagellar biosynthesis/type III secretory pathway protein FliH
MAKEFISRYDFDIQKAEARGMEKGIEKGIQKGIQKGIEEGIKKGIEKGIEKGVEKGIEKGREAEKVALVLNAFLEGLPVHLISRLVDLSEDQVEAIVREMNT